VETFRWGEGTTILRVRFRDVEALEKVMDRWATRVFCGKSAVAPARETERGGKGVLAESRRGWGWCSEKREGPQGGGVLLDSLGKPGKSAEIYRA